MKTKKFNKKLSINKETVTHLNNTELSNINGGVLTGYTCAGYCNTLVSCGPTHCPACLTEQNCP